MHPIKNSMNEGTQCPLEDGSIDLDVLFSSSEYPEDEAPAICYDGDCEHCEDSECEYNNTEDEGIKACNDSDCETCEDKECAFHPDFKDPKKIFNDTEDKGINDCNYSDCDTCEYQKCASNQVLQSLQKLFNDESQFNTEPHNDFVDIIKEKQNIDINEVSDEAFKFNQRDIRIWIETLKNGNIGTYPLIDLGDVTTIKVKTLNREQLIPRYKTLSTQFEACEEIVANIVPVVAIANKSASTVFCYTDKKVDLVCRIEVARYHETIVYYSVIDLDTYVSLAKIHIYMRDYGNFSNLGVIFKKFKPVELQEKVIYLENSISGLSKGCITEYDFLRYQCQIEGINHKNIYDKYIPYLKIDEANHLSIRSFNYKVTAIINPICHAELKDDEEKNYKEVDKKIIDLLSSFKIYNELQENIKNIIGEDSNG